MANENLIEEMANGKWQMANPQLPRVAIVHDWLIGGGAEKVVQELHRMYPEAPIYTSYCTSEWREKLDHMVVTGPLQAWPFSKLRKFIPFLRIWWFSSLKFDDYDLVISSSGAEAKGIRVPNGKWQMANGKSNMKRPLHINYCHAPTHYYWSRYEEYLRNPGFGAFNWLARFGLKHLVAPLRKWDYNSAQRPDFIIANSTHTREQIKKYYNRESVVIHPPVNTQHFGKWQMANGKSTKPRGFVVVGRQVPYKRIDLAVKACTDLSLNLIVIGDGPEHKNLQNIAGPTIKFLGKVTDKELASAISSAEAFIFPGLEDFGIAPVEALASGTPVIAYRAGGALDYIVPGKTGEFFDEQTVYSLKYKLARFTPSTYSHQLLKESAANFSTQNFRLKIQLAIKGLITKSH